MKVHESVLVAGRQMLTCAQQTARDPSASVGMTDENAALVPAIYDSVGL